MAARQQQPVPVAFDEYGRPFIIMREQKKQKRLKGLDAHKANILAAKAVAATLRTSLGPKGMDKMMVDGDGDLTITNDGRTIMDHMDVSHQIAKLFVNLSKSQDDEVGDGTTSVVVLAGALLEEAEKLLEKGIHPLRIARGYERACEIAVENLKKISTELQFSKDNIEPLIQTAMTTLSSKLVNRFHRKMAEICVKAVLAVADLERKDVNFEMIKVHGKEGGKLEESMLVDGFVSDKEFAHPQMPKIVDQPKIAMLTCPFECPKPKTKHRLDVANAEDLEKLYAAEQKYFVDQVEMVKKSGCTMVLCQWGFEDEATHLLYKMGLPAVRWVGGIDLEQLAVACNARIVPRFDQLTPDKLGTCKVVRQVEFGTSNDHFMFFEGCPNSKAITIFLRAGSRIVMEEAKRSVHDALCVVRNLIRDNRIVYGGGSPELSSSLAISKEREKVSGLEQYAMQAFADALEAIPLALAENGGLAPLEAVAAAKAEQLATGSPRLGIDVMQRGTKDMKDQGVYEPLHSKIMQLQLATQVCKMVLKIDDVISPDDMQYE